MNESFTPVPLVPDRTLIQRTERGPTTPERVQYVKETLRAARIATRNGFPSDDTLLQAYERLARRHDGEERRDG